MFSSFLRWVTKENAAVLKEKTAEKPISLQITGSIIEDSLLELTGTTNDIQALYKLLVQMNEKHEWNVNENAKDLFGTKNQTSFEESQPIKITKETDNSKISLKGDWKFFETVLEQFNVKITGKARRYSSSE